MINTPNHQITIERDRWDGLERLLAKYSMVELFQAEREHPSPLVTNEIKIRLRTEYKSKYEDWDDRASARAKPRRMLTEEEMIGKVFFPRDLVPMSNANVLDLAPSAADSLLIQRLYCYMNFTVVLEHYAVNPVLLQIGHGFSGFQFPDEMKFDAFRIYVDEGHHAQVSHDAINQIQQMTGVAPIRFEAPEFMLKLETIIATVPVELRSTARLYFTIVSETLISSILSTIPNSEEVVPFIREVVGDHAEDEGRHHAYFAKVLELTWPQLSAQEQAIIGPLIPQFMMAFLAPDRQAMRQILIWNDLDSSEADRLIEDCYPEYQVIKDAQNCAQVSLRRFTKVGVLDNSETAQAFCDAGLVT